MKIKALSSFKPRGTTNPATQHHIPNLKHTWINMDHDGDILQVKKWYCLGLQNFILFNQNEIKYVHTVHMKYKNYLCIILYDDVFCIFLCIFISFYTSVTCIPAP